MFNGVPGSPDDPAPAVPGSLEDVCGDDPRLLCEQVYDWTDGNETFTAIADFLVGRPLAILSIVVVAWIAARLARRYVRRFVAHLVAPDLSATTRRLGKVGDRVGLDGTSLLTIAPDPRRAARATSISTVVGSTVAVLIWTIATILVIGEFGFDLGPFIAGAGIAGVALGFGAQSLVKDCISGLFMLIEDQYGIGDIVDLGEASGVVEEITLRTTVLRGVDGTVWHVPNGYVQRVGNKSQLWSVALLDVDVAYDSDLEAARRLLLDTAQRICEDPAWTEQVIEPPEVLGVEALGADGITLRIVVKVNPGAQWALQRALREAFKSALDGAGIEIPFPQRTIWVRSGAVPPADADADPPPTTS